jgi:2-C-methyl-D-erythritol 4-phosphate cytidylyltransferase/2-C-methyl-D-erythritol 2,4-cyclodiphosphate synthase
MQAAGLIMAAGGGKRAGGTVPKQYQAFDGATLLRRSAEALRADARLGAIVAVIDPAFRDEAEQTLAGLTGVTLASGGATRTDSVAAGLEARASIGPDLVFIHDAARPGLSSAVMDRLFAALAAGADGAAPGLPVTDALKHCVPDGAILGSAPRDGLMRVQTPQAFRFPAILAAYRAHQGPAADDDLALAAAAGLTTVVVPGAHSLMKATYPDDGPALETMMRATIRVGSGFDVHRFGPGTHIHLCGVKVPLDRGLVGHSDADVAWHALTDALLGAVAEGDIGDHFPPSDPKWKGADSAVFLRHAAELVAARGARIVNVDLTIIGEKPKVKPHRAAMREATAALLALPLDAVSVKATTTEKLGFTGREEGLAAQAVVSVALR